MNSMVFSPIMPYLLSSYSSWFSLAIEGLGLSEAWIQCSAMVAV